YLALADA
ncbi:hypothetical protein VCHC44C1_0320B, partial [Vibrio cholerae HC-44C1]